MTADVNAISIVAYGARNATNLVAGFDHNRMNVGAAEKLESSGKPGRAGSDQ